ncbi:MAG TPA: glycosyl hydrolase family 28-related protein [Opitutaceae bacterium]
MKTSPLSHRTVAALVLLTLSSGFTHSARAGTIDLSAAPYNAHPDDGNDDTTAINAAITAAQNGDVISFAAGTYDLISSFDAERFIKISSKTGITLQGATTNGAPATRLLRHVSVTAMATPPRTAYLFNSTNVTLRNFIVDNTPHLCTTGTITAIDPNGTYVRVQIPAALPMVANMPCYSANVWEPAVDELKQVANVSANSSPANWTIHDSANRIMQLSRSAGLTFLGNVAVGERLSWHYGWNGRSQMEAGKCTNLIIDNVIVRNAINMALLIGSTNGLTLSKIVMKPEGDQLPVGPRDGIHLSRCTGVVNLSGLEITGVRMDGLVVRTPYARITNIDASDRRVFTIATELATSQQPIASGTSLSIFSSTGNLYTRVVSSAAWVSDTNGEGIYNVTTQTDLPAFAAVDTVMKVAGLAPTSVSITDSSFKNIAGSAMILFTDHITVDNVASHRVMFPPIHLGDNTGSGACGSNITIQNSHFEESGWMPKPESDLPGLITLMNVNATYLEPKLHGVTISDNTFRSHLRGASNPAINARDTDGLTMAGNLFENVGQPLLVEASSVTNDTFTTADVVIDNDGNAVTYTEVAGSFGSSGLTGYNGSTTRFAGAGAKAAWSFTAPRTGAYAVYVYKIVHPTSDTNAKLSVGHDGGTAITYVNFATGAPGWYSLGTYNFTAGNTYTITNERSNGYLRADAVLYLQQ